MRAVWSYWSKPLEMSCSTGWWSPKHHLLAWVLSVETARRQFADTALITDDAGAETLVDGIGLDFGQVSTELNSLSDSDPEWWVLGKLYAYRAQQEPFVHIDSDVFLWNPLPERMLQADVCAQHVEFFPLDGTSWYRPLLVDSLVQSVHGWVPDEWRWYVNVRGDSAISCGIFGGKRVDFIQHYADLAIRIIEHPHNAHAWGLLGKKIGDSVLLEQYFLSACIEFHRNTPESPFRDLNVRYLFESENPFDPAIAERVGYTHLIGLAKKDAMLADRLETRVLQDYPDRYERCLRYVEESGR